MARRLLDKRSMRSVLVAYLAFAMVVFPVQTAHAGAFGEFAGTCGELVSLMWKRHSTWEERLVGAGFAASIGATGVLLGLLGLLIHQSMQEGKEVRHIIDAMTPDEIAALKDVHVGPGEQWLTRMGNQIFFVKEGHMFRLDEQGKVQAARGVIHIEGIQRYKNVVIARAKEGDVQLYDPKSNEWAEIGNSATKVIGEENALVALTKNGELWRYKGEPGDLIIVWVTHTTLVPNGRGGFTTIVTMHPTVAGRQIAFEDAGVKNVASIEYGRNPAGHKDIRVKFKDGRLGWYSEIAASPTAARPAASAKP